MKSQTAAIFQQLEDDLLLYPNITQEMVEQAYCSCRRSGFRFQVRCRVLLLAIAT